MLAKDWLTSCGKNVIAVICNRKVAGYVGKGKGVSCGLICDDELFGRL